MCCAGYQPDHFPQSDLSAATALSWRKGQYCTFVRMLVVRSSVSDIITITSYHSYSFTTIVALTIICLIFSAHSTVFLVASIRIA